MRKEGELVSIIPELKTRKLQMDMREDEPTPKMGDFFVSAGKDRKVGSVYQVMSVRKVNSKVHPARFDCQVVKTPELISEAKVDYRWNATVGEHPAICFVWNPRKKKK